MPWFAATAVAVARVAITRSAEAQCVSAGGQARCEGEDIGPGDGSLPTASRANSDRARNNFFGFLSGVGTDDSDVFGFDAMTVGSLQQVRVPEPGALELLALGVLGRVAVRQRRARA